MYVTCRGPPEEDEVALVVQRGYLPAPEAGLLSLHIRYLRERPTESHLKKMKSRWLCSVATWRLRKLGSWWNSEANMRPRRCPSRVSKLFSTSSGFARAARPCPCACHEVKPSLHLLHPLLCKPCAPHTGAVHKICPIHGYWYLPKQSFGVSESNMSSRQVLMPLQGPTLMSFDSFRLDSLK